MQRQGQSELWPDLLPELGALVISFLDPNEVACSFRLVCKAAAARFSGPRHTRVRLSQPVPPPAFAHRWGAPGAMRSLTLDKRRDLLCLTASSGDLANLQLLVPLVGCTLAATHCDHRVLTAAAKAGHLHVCRWLWQQRPSWSILVLTAAGESGSWEVCEWAIAVGCPGGASAAMRGAARAGHVGLLDRLLAVHGPPKQLEAEYVLGEVAKGCNLAALQRLYAAWCAGAPGVGEDRTWLLAQLAGPASSSPTPDWRAKVEWLEAAGCRRELDAGVDSPARCPDAVERLTWMATRGWSLDPMDAVNGAAERVDLAYLEQCPPLPHEVQEDVTQELAAGGHLGALQALHSRGWALSPDIATMAAYRGHLHVVAWAAATQGDEVLTERLFNNAAHSGNLQLLVWLRGRGCPARGVWENAAGSGCEEVMEWLDANGWPLALEDISVRCRVFNNTASFGDSATEACLLRLRCL